MAVKFFLAYSTGVTESGQGRVAGSARFKPSGSSSVKLLAQFAAACRTMNSAKATEACDTAWVVV